jgi:hypothetical protein
MPTVTAETWLKTWSHYNDFIVSALVCVVMFVLHVVCIVGVMISSSRVVCVDAEANVASAMLNRLCAHSLFLFGLANRSRFGSQPKI